jgi:hypothetical protein
VPADAALLSSLLDASERAAGMAGYLALVEANQRRDVAERVAIGIETLALETGAIEDLYATRQAAILEELAQGLRAYAQGAGTGQLEAAAVENANLRQELAHLLASASQ